MTTQTSERNDTATTEYIVTNLLELVTAVADVAADDEETVAVVHHLMESGRVRLLGHCTERDFALAT